MSKNTKIVAIIGGVLILALVLFSALTKGGCGATFDVWGGMLGCSSKGKGSTASSRNNKPTKKATADDGEEEEEEEEKDEGEGEAREAPAEKEEADD